VPVLVPVLVSVVLSTVVRDVGAAVGIVAGPHSGKQLPGHSSLILFFLHLSFFLSADKMSTSSQVVSSPLMLNGSGLLTQRSASVVLVVVPVEVSVVV